MVNGAGSIYYIFLFLAMLVPVGFYCYKREQEDNKHDD